MRLAIYSCWLLLLFSIFFSSCKKEGKNDILNTYYVTYKAEASSGLRIINYTGAGEINFSAGPLDGTESFEETVQLKEGDLARLFAKTKDSTSTLKLEIIYDGVVKAESTYDCPTDTACDFLLGQKIEWVVAP